MHWRSEGLPLKPKKRKKRRGGDQGAGEVQDDWTVTILENNTVKREDDASDRRVRRAKGKTQFSPLEY